MAGLFYLIQSSPEETTPANESDIKHVTMPLEKADLEQGTPVMVDMGYDSAENRKEAFLYETEKPYHAQ